jgi:hypothetical protein
VPSMYSRACLRPGSYTPTRWLQTSGDTGSGEMICVRAVVAVSSSVSVSSHFWSAARYEIRNADSWLPDWATTV